MFVLFFFSPCIYLFTKNSSSPSMEVTRSEILDTRKGTFLYKRLLSVFLQNPEHRAANNPACVSEALPVVIPMFST